MKKLIAASLSLAMLFGLTACGSSKDDDTPIEKPSAVATQAKTEATTSDVIQYDPLETVELTISPNSGYPKSLSFDYDYKSGNYEDQEFVNGKVVSADTNEIVVELSVDEKRVAEHFRDTPYVLKNTKKELTFFTKDIYCLPINSDSVTENVVSEIGDKYKKDLANKLHDDELSVEAIYVVTIKEDELFLSDYQFIKNGKYDGTIFIWETGRYNPYQLWFAYKNKDGNVFLRTTRDLKINNGEYYYNQIPFSTSEDIFDTIEEAKQSIENNIADYDNVKLEEIEIPEVLK